MPYGFCFRSPRHSPFVCTNVCTLWVGSQECVCTCERQLWRNLFGGTVRFLSGTVSWRLYSDHLARSWTPIAGKWQSSVVGWPAPRYSLLHRRQKCCTICQRSAADPRCFSWSRLRGMATSGSGRWDTRAGNSKTASTSARKGGHFQHMSNLFWQAHRTRMVFGCRRADGMRHGMAYKSESIPFWMRVKTDCRSTPKNIPGVNNHKYNSIHSGVLDTPGCILFITTALS